jgi:hypothetical protein
MPLTPGFKEKLAATAFGGGAFSRAFDRHERSHTQAAHKILRDNMFGGPGHRISAFVLPADDKARKSFADCLKVVRPSRF